MTRRRRCCARRARPRRSRRSSTPSTRATPTRSCSPTSTCRRCRKIAEGASSKLWIIPSEFTEALKGMSGAFAGFDRGRMPAGAARDAAIPTDSRRLAAAVVTHPWFERRCDAARARAPGPRDRAAMPAHASWRTRSPRVAAAHAAGVIYVESDCHLTRRRRRGAVPRRATCRRVTGDPRRVDEVTSASWNPHGASTAASSRSSRRSTPFPPCASTST